MSPLVSCVMLCSYPKRAPLIQEALLSYDLQTHSNRELIVVNDGAPLRALRPDVTVLNVPAGMTLGVKRNIGLRYAAGPYAATWDDDDFSWPERLTRLVKVAESTGAGSVRSNAIWMADAAMRIGGLVPSAAYQAGLMRVADALSVGGYPDLNYLEDMELFIRMAVRARPSEIIRDVLYVQRRHDSNFTNAHGETLSKHLLRALPQAADAMRVAQTRLDDLRAQPAPTLIEPAP